MDALRIERRDETRSGLKSWAAVFVFILLLAAALGAWAYLGSRAPEVRTATARAVSTEQGDRTVLNASGYVTARRSATVSSKVTGKVVEVLVEEGTHVKEGQILATLDQSNLRIGLKLAEGRVLASKAATQETRVRIDEAEKELKRQTELLGAKVSMQADFDKAEAALLAFKARLLQQESEYEVSRLDVENWQQQLEDTVIRAPFAGVVTSKNAQPGEMISPVSAGGGFTRTGICTIVDMESLEIEIDVNESYINRVEPGQAVTATLDAYPNWRIPCKVIAIIPTADRQKSTVRVRVGFEKLDPKILPEMSVKVAFQESTGPGQTGGAGTLAKTVVIPRSAVENKDGTDVVLVFSGGKVERRAVTVSGRNGDEMQISAGLSEGEKVLLERPKGVADGARMREKK